MDTRLADLFSLIDRYGWAVRFVFSGPEDTAAPPFAYTVGLTAFGHSEFVMTGMPQEHAHQFLNVLGGAVRDGRRFVRNTVTHDLTTPGCPLAFIDVIDTRTLCGVVDVYGSVQALQVVWCDSSGALPWEAGYRNALGAQPLLGVRPDTWTTDDRGRC